MDASMLKRAYIGAAQYLEDHKEEVDKLNVFPVPDGDTGTNMSLTMKSSSKHVMNSKANTVAEIAKAASDGALMGARGNSGVILSQLLRGFSAGLEGLEVATTADLARALRLASETAYKAVMKPTEGTILTVARRCGEYGEKIFRKETDIIDFSEKVIVEGNNALNETPEMLPVLKQAGVVDAGGKGLMCVLIGAFNAISGEEDLVIESFDSDIEMVDDHSFIHESLSPEDIKYGYCTEFIINTDYNYEDFRKDIEEFGDSMMVVGNDGLIKTHIHTNNPGAVLEKAIVHGELIDIKIDNMRHQHRSLENHTSHEELKDYGFITVSVGDGIEKLFKELNVDVVIPGGQTMNPSTEDILKAVDKIRAEKIIILPNNGNIVLAADQAKELSDKDVYVYPTKTIPEGITALLNFDYDLPIEENFELIEEAVSSVITAQVTYAVRDTEIDGKEIKENDIIGISKGDILSIGKDVKEVASDLIDNIKSDDSSLITIYYGNGIEEDEAEELMEELEEKFEDFDIELVYGGQPLYYYLFSIE